MTGRISLPKEVQNMEKLFAALRELHPGCEVVDIRLLANQNESDDQDPRVLDGLFAAAIASAVPIEISSLT
jgi:hypothetical protein